MVQFFKGSADPRDAALGALSRALGQGLGHGVMSHFANESLNDVINDPQFKNSSPYERMSALQQALSKYGNVGQQLLQQRMQLEQQYAQEDQKKKSEEQLRQKGKALNKYIKKEPLSDEEMALFSPQEMAAIEKAYNRGPAGGVTAQPVPEGVSKAISQVLSNAQGMDPDQLKQAMDAAGIPPAYSNSYVENRRQTTKPVFEPASDKLEAERSAKVADEIENEYKSVVNEDIRLDRQTALMEKGNLSTPAMVKLIESLGLPLGILNNPDTEEFAKLEADFVRDVSKVFPGQIRVYEIQAYLKTVPSLMNSREGQEAIIHNRKLMNEAKKVRYDAYKDIIKENNGRKPPNLDMLIHERTQKKMDDIAERFKAGIDAATEMNAQTIRMYDAQGKAYDIPANKIPDAQNSGLKFGR